MKYYLLESKSVDDGILIPMEYSGSVQKIIEEGVSRKIKYVRNQDRAIYDPSNLVISESFKNFLINEKIEEISFIEFDAIKGDPEDDDDELDEANGTLKCFVLKLERLSDCIDLEESDVVIIGGRIRRTNKLVLKKENLKSFCMVDEYRSNILVSEEMKEKLENSGLKGLKFIDTEGFSGR